MLAIVGDFNVDFDRANVPRTREPRHFMQFTGLKAVDLLFPSVQFTYFAVYQSCGRVLCEQLVIPDDVVKCSNPHCLAHCKLLDSICHKLVQCLLTSAEATIPQAKFKKGVDGWNG